MEFHKQYKGSYIFSEVITSMKKEGLYNNNDFVPNLDFLEKKNATLNQFKDIQYYNMIDIQKEGNVIFEKNISFDLGLENHTIFKIIELSEDVFLREDAEMDKVFTEFFVEKKLNPLDLFLINEHPIKNKAGEDRMIKRIITILSVDEKGFPLFGFCALSINTNLKLTNTFSILSSVDDIDITTELTTRIENSITQLSTN